MLIISYLATFSGGVNLCLKMVYFVNNCIFLQKEPKELVYLYEIVPLFIILAQ